MSWLRHWQPRCTLRASASSYCIRRQAIACTSLVSPTRCSSTEASSAEQPLHLVPKTHYTTTPIFYVNAEPHIGHLYSVVLADVFSRWAQWRHGGWSAAYGVDKNKETKAVLATGTDEHGMKVQKAAESREESPQELCDRVSGRFKALANAAGADVSRFIRTTDSDHVQAVEHLWKELEKRGYIYLGKHEGWYSTSDEAFYTATQVRQSATEKNVMVSIETGSVVEWSTETNYKFRLSAFKERLLKWLRDDPYAIVPFMRHSDVVQELEENLEDLSISRPRSRLTWGIPVPVDHSQTIYVWLDALTNYLTVSGYPWHGEDAKSYWPTDVQVIGKDIVRFHCIYFPAFLMALDLPLPRQTVVHGHWTKDRLKMSKSLGNGADPFAAIDTYGRDGLRYLLCRFGGNLTSDANWSDSVMVETYRKVLVGQLGNLISRAMSPKLLKLLFDREEGRGIAIENSDDPDYVSLPRPTNRTQRMDDDLEKLIVATALDSDYQMRNFRLSALLQATEKAITHCNVILHFYEPWKLKKLDNRADDAGFWVRWKAIYYAMETSRICAMLLHPIMPEATRRALEQLHVLRPGSDDEFPKWNEACQLRELVRIPRKGIKPDVLFPPLRTE